MLRELCTYSPALSGPYWFLRPIELNLERSPSLIDRRMLDGSRIPTQHVEDPDKDEEEDVLVDEYGRPKKKKKNRDYDKKNKSCHFCLNRHPRWKMAFCTNCDLAYCYGTLFRAHDMMPLDVMEVSSWKCPHCRRVCNTGNCRRDPRQHPYEPKGTLLGHDTKKVADPRSVEVLVDFSVSNLNWLKEDEVTGINNGPMQHRRSEAERAKLDDPTLDDRYMDEDEHIPRNGSSSSPSTFLG